MKEEIKKKALRRLSLIKGQLNCCSRHDHLQSSDGTEQATCPIMKAPVDKEGAEAEGLVREYNGQKYYFCCASCPRAFDKNPESYAGK